MIPPDRLTAIEVFRDPEDGRIRLALVGPAPAKPRIPPGREEIAMDDATARALAARLSELAGEDR